jgi:hypothetical protein
VTETSKVVDVLLPLGIKQHSCVQGNSFCLHYTLCLMQLSVVRNLILMRCSDDIPVGGLLVIDAVGWRSMYFVVMPRVNLMVILATYACYLYSINCPTAICLPSMCYLSYGETPLVNCNSFTLLSHVYFTRTVYFTRILLLLSTRYAHCFAYSKPVRLTTSS